MNEKIKLLEKENKELKKKIEELEEEATEIIRAEKEESEKQ